KKTGPNQLIDPIRIDVDQNGNIYISDRGGNNGRIIIFDKEFDYVGVIDEFGSPGSVVIDDNGFIYIADLGNVDLNEFIEVDPDILSEIISLLLELLGGDFKVQVFSSNLEHLATIQDQIGIPLDLALDNCGHLIVNNG